MQKDVPAVAFEQPPEAMEVIVQRAQEKHVGLDLPLMLFCYALLGLPTYMNSTLIHVFNILQSPLTIIYAKDAEELKDVPLGVYRYHLTKLDLS